MADNAAQSIKDLQERLVSADKTIGEMLQRLGKYESWVSLIFTGIAQNAKVSIDEIGDYLTKKMRRENLKQSESLMKDILGTDEAKKEIEKMPTMFDRVISQINQRAQQSGENFAKKLVNAESAKNEAEEFARTFLRSFQKAQQQIQHTKGSVVTAFSDVPQSLQPWINTVFKYMDTSRGHQALVNNPITRYAEALKQLQELERRYEGTDNALGRIYKNALIKVREYIEEVQKVKQLEEQAAQSQQKYASNVSAIEGVTRRYNDNEQAIQRIIEKWEELNVKKQAGLVNDKDFKTQTQKILDEYDRLIAKRREFEIEDLGKMSSERTRQREEEEERLNQLRKSNTQARLDDEMRAERMIKQARAERAKKEAEADANMKKAVSQQVTNYKQLSALLKQYNSLKQVKGRTQEEEAALERTRQKIKEIIAEMRKLDSEQKGSLGKARDITEYDRILAKDREITNEKKKQNDLTKQQKANLNSLLPTLQRLASAFGIAFSVRGLAQFVKKLIETRGEFERQQVALRSILQNKQLADEIWDKTMQAALQSPFTAMQLTTYTKQLAAYRIETDKLFETTKRLADVSAGLGVDMQRLILAYGQVKAANYLRASEIRQFTEAGVNVLGELRDYFNDIKGMSVDTAQVMEMVTKRLVTFEDVEAIFKRMTDQGGIFYEMQYVQSQTVRGQIAKLHDAYDQMLNSIGQANEGVLKNMVSLLNSIVKNWQEFKTVIDLIAWPLLISFVYKFSRGLMTTATASRLASEGMSKVVIAGAKTKEMFTKLFATIATHPFIALGAAVAAVGVALLNHAKHVRDINKRYEDLMLRTYETQKNLDGLSDTLQKNLDTMKEATKGSEEYNEASRENENIVKKLKDQYPELLQDIDLQKDGYEKLIEKIKEYNDELENQIRLEYAARASFGQDDLTTNIADLQETQREREMQFLRNREKAENNYLELKAKGKEAEEDEWDARIRNAKTWQEQYDILIEFARTQGARSSGYELPIGLSATWGRDVETRTKDLEKNIENEALVFNDIIRDQLKTINEDLGDDIQQFITDNETQINELFKDKEGAGWKLLNKQITKFFTAKGATSKETRQVIQDFLNKYLLVPIQLDWGGSETTETATKELADWQKRVNEAIDKASSDFNKKRAELSEDAKKNMPEIEVYKIKDPLKTLEDAQSEILKKLKEVRAKIASYEVKGQVAIDNAEYQALKLTEQEMEQVRVLLGAVAKVTGGGGRKENASKLISLIKEMRSEYDKLSKSAYGYAKSEEKVREAYKDSVKEILGKAGITDYDFTTNEGMIKALDKVKSYATKLGKDAAAEVQKYIDQLETEIEINAQVRIREDFGKQMEKAFSDYELTIELEKLNISPEAAKDWLNFDYTSLGDMLNAMNDFANKLIEKNDFDEEDAKIYQQWAKKIEDQIYKARKEKAKEYSKYLETELSERAKLEMEYAKKVAEVKASPVFQGEQQDAILNNMNREFNEKLQELTWKSFKESDFYVEMMEDLTSIPAEYSALMLTKLNEILMHPEKLSPRALKEAINARQKIMEARRQMNPALAMSENLRSYREFYTNQGNRDEFGLSAKTSRAARKEIQALIIDKSKELSQLEEEINIYDDLIGEIENYNNLKKEYDEKSQGLAGDPEEEISQRQELLECLEYEQQRYEDLRDAKQRGEEIDEEEFNSLAKEINVRQQNITQLNAEINAYREAEVARKALGTAYANLSENAQNLVGGGEIQIGSTSGITSGNIKSKRQATADKKDNTKSAIQRLKDARKNEVEFAKAWHEFNAQLNDTIGKVKNMGNAFYDTFDALGGETDALTEGWKEFGSTMIDAITSALTMIPTLVTGFTAAGVAINSAMGIIGLIAEAIQLVLVLITGLAKLHDAGYEAEIERQQKKIDDLQRAYDRLEKQIEKTWDTESYIRTYNEETQNLYAQIEALNKQIAAENAKKDTDADKIQGYKDSIRDAEDELEELKQKQIEVFGGIGEEGYRDAAQEFVDAWKSAFLETGDGLQGLQEHFDEFLNDWFVKQATMRVAGRMLEPLFRQIDQAVDQYSNGGANVLMQELQEVREKFGVLAPQLSEALEELAGMWGLGGEGALSGLAAGIQGMTEEQANILEAYWNSVRGYTASIDFNVARIADMMASETEGRGVDFNPMLQQLNLIAANTQATHQLLQSVTKSGHSQGGYGIKVFAD